MKNINLEFKLRGFIIYIVFKESDDLNTLGKWYKKNHIKKKIKEYLVDYLDNKKLNLHNFFISGIKVTITKIKRIKYN